MAVAAAILLTASGVEGSSGADVAVGFEKNGIFNMLNNKHDDAVNSNSKLLSSSSNVEDSSNPSFFGGIIQQHPHQHRSLAFGDYVDPTFACPATTTCRTVCVASASDCPTDAQCPPNYQLCADGTCVNLLSSSGGESCNDEGSPSPCACETLPFACAKQIDTYPDGCLGRFQEFYSNETDCIDAQVESLTQVSFVGPWFVTCYVGISVVTALMLLWCVWNQKLARVAGSTVLLESAAKKKNGISSSINSIRGAVRSAADNATAAVVNKDEEGGDIEVSANSSTAAGEGGEIWTQTGYKATIVGMIVYGLVILAHLVIQFLLLALTVEYCELLFIICVWISLLWMNTY